MVMAIGEGTKMEFTIGEVLSERMNDGNIKTVYGIKEIPNLYLSSNDIAHLKVSPVVDSVTSSAVAVDERIFIPIGQIDPGMVVKTKEGMKLQVLDNHYGERGGVFCITRDILFKKAFDEDNCNDWRKSSLRKYLNGEFFEQLPFADKLISFKRDLTSDDGLKDYGDCEDYVSLLSDDEYRKYRYQISNKDDWWWTLTPYSTPGSGSSRNARYVYSDGSRGNYYAYYGSGGVSPAFVILPSFMVEIVHDDGEEEDKE